MSNRIDFFQSGQTQPAMSAGLALIYLDGVLCSYLEVLEIVRDSWPQFSSARLIYNPAGCSDASYDDAEDIAAKLSAGKSISIHQVYNGAAPGTSVFSVPVFAGQIEGIDIKLGQQGEEAEVTARDISATLERISVYGRRAGSADGSSVFLAGAETAFNEDGNADASAKAIENNGYTLTVFSAEPSQAKLWSCAEVICYLLCEYLPKGRLQTPGIEQLQAITENQTVRDLNVTGLNLLKALQRCCERVGLKFKFVPRFTKNGPEQAIVFYKNGTGREVELNCQQRGERFSISRTNISRLHSRGNFWPVTHKYIGQGDFKVYEATFDLVRAWDPAGEDINYAKFSPSTNDKFYQLKDVYRKWCLNEAGNYSGTPYNRGSAYDFLKIFEGGTFIHRRRRFWPTLTADKQGKSLGYFLEVSFDNGLHWRQYLDAFNNLLDECGIWLSSDQLDVDTWVAALKRVLKFRMTASVISDERLTCTAADGPEKSVIPVVEHIITLPRQFKYRKVSSRSIFASAGDTLGEADEADDTTALYEFVRKTALAEPEIIATADVQTPYLVLDYQVGDRVTSSPQSRDLLGVKSDNRSVSWIERVQMDFKNQCTNLKIVRSRKVQL